MTAGSRLAAVVATLTLGACASPIHIWHGAAGDSEAVGSESEALIRQAGAESLFVSEPQGSMLGARHRKSGMLCTFEPGEHGNRILVYRQEPELPPGDEVGCTSTVNGVFQSLRATRITGRDDLDAAFRQAVDGVKLATPDARIYQGDYAENAQVDVDGRPLPLADHRTGRFVVDLGGRKQFTRVSVAVVNGWGVKQWVSGPLEDAVALDVEAESMMTMVLVDFAMRARSAAQPAPALP